MDRNCDRQMILLDSSSHGAVQPPLGGLFSCYCGFPIERESCFDATTEMMIFNTLNINNKHRKTGVDCGLCLA